MKFCVNPIACNASRGTPDHPLANQPIPLYEDVNVLPSAVEHQEQGLELRENVAYGPSKSMDIKY